MDYCGCTPQLLSEVNIIRECFSLVSGCDYQLLHMMWSELIQAGNRMVRGTEAKSCEGINNKSDVIGHE